MDYMVWEHIIDVMRYGPQSLSNYKNPYGLVDFAEELEDFKNEVLVNLEGNLGNPPIKKYILKIKECKDIHHSIHIESQSLAKSFNEWKAFIAGQTPDLPCSYSLVILK
jgi:hypothetical protein